MDYGFSEEQEMFRNSVRDFLEKECSRSLVREIEEQRRDYSPDLYRKMASLGWLGLGIPEEYGGVEGSWVDMAILYEEAGRALLPSPHFSTVVLGAQAILALGREEQKSNLLPRIADGDIIVALALTEPQAGSNLELLTTSATAKGEGYVINGTKLFINYAHLADYIVTVVKTGENKTSVFLVEKGSPGLTCSPVDTLGGERLCEVAYQQVEVPSDYVLGKLDEGSGICEVVEKAKVMSCVSMVGSAQVTLEMAIDYAKERTQFGVPIGSFQALQHKMATMALDIEGVRWLGYYVAWLISENIPCAMEMAMLNLKAGQTCRSVTSESIQIHGAVATMEDHDLSLYFRKVKATQLNLGYPETHRETIAQHLGLL